MKTDNFYDLWKLPQDEQEILLGEDIGLSTPTIIVELDVASQQHFYNERFAPLCIKQYEVPSLKAEVFQVILHSIDDHSLNMTWEVKKMRVPSYEARQWIENWLKRTNYFVNFKGFEHFCICIFGKAKVDYN